MRKLIALFTRKPRARKAFIFRNCVFRPQVDRLESIISPGGFVVGGVPAPAPSTGTPYVAPR